MRMMLTIEFNTSYFSIKYKSWEQIEINVLFLLLICEFVGLYSISSGKFNK